MGWQVRLLPYIEQHAMLQTALAAFRSEPVFVWNPPHVGLSTVLPGYICPSDARLESPQTSGDTDVAFTSYLGNEGLNQLSKDGLLFIDSAIRADDVSDGMTNTILAGERPPTGDYAFGWWYAGIGLDRNGACDMVGGVRELNTRRARSGVQGCPRGPHRFQQGRISDLCSMFHFWSLHPGGAHFLFADGAIKFLPYSADAILPALATRAGGEAVSPPD